MHFVLFYICTISDFPRLLRGKSEFAAETVRNAAIDLLTKGKIRR